MDALIVGWLLLSLIVAAGATHFGRSGFGWFLISALLSPLLGLFFLLVAGRVDSGSNQGSEASGAGNGQCPFCLERVVEGAKKCKHCGSEIPAGHWEPKASAQPTKAFDRNALERAVLLALAIIGAAVVLYRCA